MSTLVQGRPVSVTLDPESRELIQSMREMFGKASASAVVRHAVRQTYQQMQREREFLAR
jgi:Arc/MetJ-type ribon-helix-helix transcriptional regulator